MPENLILELILTLGHWIVILRKLATWVGFNYVPWFGSKENNSRSLLISPFLYSNDVGISKHMDLNIGIFVYNTQ